MTWKSLLKQRRVEPHATSKAELDDLRVAVARNLQDAMLPDLSVDNRFAIAYQAALIATKMAIACAGYRVIGSAAHKTTFEALPLAMGSSLTDAARYFNRCRRKRNDLTYVSSGTVSSSDATELRKKASELLNGVELWIATHFPDFK